MFTLVARHKPAVIAGIAGVVVVLLAVLAAAWDLSRRGRKPGDPVDTPKQAAGNPLARGDKRIYSRQEFEKEVLGLHTAEVRSLLGAPDGVETPMIIVPGDEGNEGYWRYRGRTVDPATGKLDDQSGAILWIEHDKVVRVDY